MKHTPGPWTSTGGYSPQIVADGALIVPRVCARRDAIGGEHLTEIHANARLLASSPQMLDALNQILRRASCAPHDDEAKAERAFKDIMRIAGAAIREAVEEAVT